MMLLNWKNTTHTKFLQFHCIKEVRRIVDNPLNKVAAIQMDWAENTKFFQFRQENSAYYYDIQVSVNTTVVYQANKSTTWFGSLSDNTSHKKTAVWASLNSMMDVINLDVDTLELLYLITVLQIRTGQRSINVNLWPLTAHICHVMIMVTSGFSKKSLLLSEPVVPRCSSK